MRHSFILEAIAEKLFIAVVAAAWSQHCGAEIGMCEETFLFYCFTSKFSENCGCSSQCCDYVFDKIWTFILTGNNLHELI